MRLRGKYLKLEITPAEEAALAEAQKLGAELLATLPAGPITTAPTGLHVTGTRPGVIMCGVCAVCLTSLCFCRVGFALGFRCIHRCHCCYSCRVCERSVYGTCLSFRVCVCVYVCVCLCCVLCVVCVKCQKPI